MKNLINAVLVENEKRLNDTVKTINEKIEANELTWWIESYLTKMRISQLKKDEITKEKAIEIATKKATKKFEIELKKELEKIESIKNSIDFDGATIKVEWKKSNMWGMNPKAELSDNKNNYIGDSISGCGYDKESTAIANVLNQHKPFLKLMYQKRNDNIEINNHELIGYGSGYGILPYFEGGVGTSCLYKICESIGLKFENVANGNNFGVFKISVNN